MRLALPFLFLLALPANAASFDCAKAKTQVEKLICASKPLSELDSDLADEYDHELANADDEASVVAQQRAWMNSRNKCSDAKCLQRAYEARLKTLACEGNRAGSANGAISCAEAMQRTANRSLAFAEAQYAKALLEMYRSENRDVLGLKNMLKAERDSWERYTNDYCTLIGETESGTHAWQNANTSKCVVEATEARVHLLTEKTNAHR